MMKNLLPGQIYTNQNGYRYLCKQLKPDGSAIMMRISDGWTLIAHGVQMYPTGLIEWNYSTEGHWCNDTEEKRM